MKIKVYSYVRWSHPSQTLGDSETRQINKAIAWAKSKGLELEEKTFKDSGISAKAGLNRADGSQFKDLLNYVQSGDYILIEDYDRFSRQDPITSLTALRSILKDKQIKIVFLSEGVEVTQDNFLNDNIILPLFLKGFLGYRENTKKGERVEKAWKSKRDEMKAGKFVVVKLPCWLEHKDGKYIVIENKAKIIRRMFKLCNEGKGSGEITKIFNTEKVKRITTLKKKTENGFNQVFILNCLRNKKTIGTNEVIEIINGKEISTEVANVYPSIIDNDTFFKAQAKIHERTLYTGIKIKDDNMYSGICKCFDCGKRLFKASNKPGYDYLRCPSVKAGLHKGKGINYDRFNLSFINLMVEDKEWLAGLNGEEKPNKLNEYDYQLKALNKKLIQVTADYEETPSKMLAGIMAKIENDIANLNTELDKEKAQVASSTPLQDGIEQLQNDMLEIDHKKGAQSIRGIIEKIVMDGNKQEYEVFFKNTTKTAKVQLGKDWQIINGVRYDTGFFNIKPEAGSIENKEAKNMIVFKK